MFVKRALAALLLGLGGLCSANPTTKISDMILPIDNQPTSKIVKFPAIKKMDGKTAVMKFQLFYDRPQPGGWNALPTIVLNGQQLSRFTTFGEERLLRRGMDHQSLTMWEMRTMPSGLSTTQAMDTFQPAVARWLSGSALPALPKFLTITRGRHLLSSSSGTP